MHELKIGDYVTLQNLYCWTETPYQVLSVSKSGKRATIGECKLIFYGTWYFYSIPDEIGDYNGGMTREIYWSEKGYCWKESYNRHNDVLIGVKRYLPYLD